MALPTKMKTTEVRWTTSGGIEKNLQVNNNAPLPKGAQNLPKDSTLVRIAYTSVNPVDYKLLEMPLVSRLLTKVSCLDFSGTVVATTRSDLKAGDEVFGKTDPPVFGCLAEYVVIGKEACVKVPDGVSLEQTGGVGVCGLTAYQCIAPFVKAGDKVFINGGSGGTGTFGIQFAKALGCTVTTTCSGANVELCKSLGADEVIDYRTNEPVAHLKRAGIMYDHIVDNVNTPGIYWNAEQYLKPGGRWVVIAGDATLSSIYSLGQIFLLPTFLGGGKRKPVFPVVQSKTQDYEQIAQWMKEGKVKTVIENVYEQSKAGEAYARLKSGRTRGKLIVKIDG